MLMRFWQILVMAALSMIVERALLGIDVPVRTDTLQNAVTDLALLAGYVNAATWAVAAALATVVWVGRAVAPGLPRLRHHGYDYHDETSWVEDATIRQLFDVYCDFVRYGDTMSVTRSIPWGGWAGLKRLVDLAPVLVGCLALVSPVREVVPWLGVVGVLMVLAHLWKHQTFPT